MLRSFTSALPQVGALMVGVSLLALAGAACAQDATPPAGADAAAAKQDSTVVIVTANKRAENVQKVAQTDNVVSSAEIQNLQITSVQELTNFVGGLSLTETSPSEQSLSLRGIKMVNGEPTTNTVESYLNDVPISVIDAFGSTLDLGQIEVLKGPQGTLRGRPSPSGAMTITTQKPSFTTDSGYMEVSDSDQDHEHVEAAYGGPISDTLAFRVAGVFDHNDLTQVKDIATGKSDFQETFIPRVSLSWKPIEKLQVDGMLQYTHQNGDFFRQVEGTAPCAGSLPAPEQTVSSVGCGQTFTLFQKIALNDVDGGENPNHYYGVLGTINARYELNSHLDAFYVGGYNDNDYFTNLNFDFAGVGAANGLTYLTNDAKTRTITNEVRLQSSGYDFYNFTYGAFFSHQTADGTLIFPGVVAGASLTDTTTDDVGYFTNQRFNLGDHDAVQAGVRYSQTKFNTGRTYQSITGNADYQHQFTKDLMAYISVGTAYRPGTGDAQASPVPGVIPASFGNVNAEKSRSYEFGIKSQWLDHHLTANLALFSQKYDGYIGQQFNVACTGVPNPNGPAIATATGTLTGNQCFGTILSNGNAVSKGTELEVRARVTDKLTINAIYTYTNAHYVNAYLPCNDYDNSGTVNTNGEPMVQPGKYVSMCHENGPLGSLPALSFTTNANYDMEVYGFPAYIRTSSYTHSTSYFPQTGSTFPASTTWNVYLGILNHDRSIELSLWAKNVFNKVTQDTDGGGWNIGSGVPSGLTIGTVTDSREVGVTLRKTF